MNTILELVKEYRQPVMKDAHTWRRNALRSGDSSWQKIQELQRAGFTWIVEAAFYRVFRYHASVLERPCAVTMNGKNVIYIGDIPESALERIELALSCGIKVLTIHSNEELAIRRTMPMRTDPVVLGWFSQNLTFRSDGSQDGYDRITSNASDIAFVIAVWDNAVELEL